MKEKTKKIINIVGYSIGIAGIFAGFVCMGITLFLSHYYDNVYCGERNPFILFIETMWWVYSFVILIFIFNKIIHDLVNENLKKGMNIKW